MEGAVSAPVHATDPDGLRAIRQRVADLRAAAAELDRLGEPDMAAELRGKAARLGAFTLRVDILCLLHRGTFTADFDADGDPHAGLGPGVCGPCMRRTDLEVAAAFYEESGKRGVDAGTEM
jgi:hypothetical protein